MPLVFERVLQSFASMKQRDFRYLTFSTGALGFGQWFQQVGLNWLVLEVTGSAAQMGIITFIKGIVILLSSLPAGVISDRFSRRDVIVWTTFAGVVQAVALAALVLAGMIETWHLYLFAVIGGAAQGVTQPARQAFVYDVTDRELLTNALTVNSMAQNAARVTGPPLAGAIIGLGSTASAFAVLAVLNIVSMGLTLMIRTRGQVAAANRPKESAFASLKEGLRYSFGNRLILALLIATSIAPVLVYPYVQFLPMFAKDVLHGGPETYGVLASGLGWGSLVGLSGLAYFGDVKHKGMIFFVTHLLYVALILAFARTDTLWLAMACLIISGVFWSVMQVLSNTLFQLAATNEMRGRVMSLHSMSAGLQPAGALPMGFAIERWGAADTFAGFMMVAILALAAVAVFFPQLRRSTLSATDAPSGLPGAAQPAGASARR